MPRSRATSVSIDFMVAGEAPPAIKFTGGSSGVPKGVVQSHRSMSAAMQALRSFYRLSCDDVNLAVAPLSHGASHYVLPVLAAGGCHVVLREPDRKLILRELRSRVSIVFMPPTLIRLLMSEESFTPADLPRLRHLTYSAAPMAPAQIDEALLRFGLRLSTLYGQTEAPLTICGLLPMEMAWSDLRYGVGRALPGVSLAVLTDGGAVVGRDATGEVMVKGDLTDTHYLDAPELTAASRHEGWLRTGDVGQIDSNGYLRLVGRCGDLIITGGYNVYPAEVESALVQCDGVSEACAFGVPDETWGERLEAVVTLAGHGGGVSVESLRANLRHAIGPVRTPKNIHVLPGPLPRNAVGKVVRNDIRALVYAPAREQARGPCEETRP